MEDFNFRMLRLAREHRQVTQSALAAASGIAQARISRVESGQLNPTAAEIRAVATTLVFPDQFFSEPGVPAAAPLFRKRAIRSARRLNLIQARLNLAVLIAERLLDGVEIEPPNYFPAPGEIPADAPKEAAAALRRDWRVAHGRIDDMVHLVEEFAGVVLPVDFATDDASAAFISTSGGARLWFLVNTRESAGDRVRLSLAHELGHAVLHRMLPTMEEAESELQAFQFAAALLLPPEDFDQSVPLDALTLARARELKRAFGVSIQAVVRAAYDRGRISRTRYTSLFKQISSRQWRRVEPDPILLETPQLWEEILKVHRREHGYDDQTLAALARVSPDDLSDLFPANFRSAPRLRVVSSTRSR